MFGELPTEKELKQWVYDITHHSMLHETTKKFMEDSVTRRIRCRCLSARSPRCRACIPMPSWCAAQPIACMDPAHHRQGAFHRGHVVPAQCRFPYVYPDNDLSYTENFMNMLWKMVEPKYVAHPAIARALDILFILHADHEQNCSTSAMRAVGSSETDPYLAVASAASALAGVLHGGANEEVLKMLDEIGRKDNVPAYIKRVKDGHFKLMGFGHRIYKNYDPRAKIIRWSAEQVFEVTGRNPKLDIALELERIALEDEYFVKRKLYPNVDFLLGHYVPGHGLPAGNVHRAVSRFRGRRAGWRNGRN